MKKNSARSPPGVPITGTSVRASTSEKWCKVSFAHESPWASASSGSGCLFSSGAGPRTRPRVNGRRKSTAPTCSAVRVVAVGEIVAAAGLGERAILSLVAAQRALGA